MKKTTLLLLTVLTIFCVQNIFAQVVYHGDTLFTSDISQYGLTNWGIEFDGTNYFLSDTETGNITKLDAEGNFVEVVHIEGVNTLKDITTDGTYYYGKSSFEDNYIYQLDFATYEKTPDSIPIPNSFEFPADQIAYDPINDAFWLASQVSDLVLIDRTGTEINRIPTSNFNTPLWMGGIAFDNITTPGEPCLWIFNFAIIEGNMCPAFIQVDITNKQETGLIINAIDIDDGESPVVKGTFIYEPTATIFSVLNTGFLFPPLLSKVAGFDLNSFYKTDDIGIDKINSPQTNSLLGETEEITVTLFNNGANTLSNFDVNFSLDGGSIVTETITDEIDKYSKYTYTFTATIDLSTEETTYSLEINTDLTDDTNPDNNTITSTIINVIPSEAPYQTTFPTELDLGWKIINANEDYYAGSEATWYWQTNANYGHNDDTYINTGTLNANFPMDDWLVSKAIYMEAGIYNMSFWYMAVINLMTTNPQNLTLYFGTDNTPQALSNLIVDYTNFNNSTYQESSTDFTINTDGYYYFGWHNTSAPENPTGPNGMRIDDINLTLITNVTDIKSENFKIYPNPSNGIFTINNEQLIINNLTITNITGKIIYNSQFSTFNSQFSIDISNQPAGIYFINIKTETGIYTEKLIIQ